MPLFSLLLTWGRCQRPPPPPRPCQFSCPCVCLVHQVIVHEVPGQELEVEVYDKDPDQDDFLGRYIMHATSCVQTCIIVFHLSSFMDRCKRTLLFKLLLYEPLCINQDEWFFLTLSSLSTAHCRTTLDLGIVKKSIVVDDVSSSSQSQCVQHMQYWQRLSPQWFTLKDTESGRVHFKLEWLSLLPSTERLEQVWITQHTFLNRPARSHSNILVVLIQVLKRNESISSNAGDPPSSAILVVYLDKAEELPVSHTSTRRAHIHAGVSAAFCACG